MGKRPDKGVGDGEKSEADAAKPLVNESAGTANATPQAEAIDSNLPVVEAPKLDGSDAMVPPALEAMNELPMFGAGEASTPPDVETMDDAPSDAEAAAPPRSSRFALLAAAIALAAALGSFFGSLTASGVVRLLPAAGEKAIATADARDVLQAMRTELAELTALKANVDTASRSANSQFARITDRLDRLDKRAAAASAAPETTGSITTAAPPAAEPKSSLLDGWMVQDVQNGRALVASRYGGVFEVGAGSFLPGIGRVEAIKREDGKWMVVTARGVITSVH